MRSAALLVALALAGNAAAQGKGFHQEDIRATLDSPLIQQVLGERFADDPNRVGYAIETLRASGNLREGDLLDRARKRIILAQMTGAPFDRPATNDEAIRREAALPDFGEAVGEGLRRVRVERTPATATVEALQNDTTNVELAFTFRNGLAVPLRHLAVRVAPPGGEDGLGMSCDLDGSGGAFVPGETRTVPCRGYDRSDRIQPAVQSLAQRTASIVVSYAGTVDSILSRDTVVFEERVRGSAHATLAAASCREKGTCAQVQEARELRADEEAKARRPSDLAALGIAAAFLAGLLAAVRTRPVPGTGWAMSLLAAAVAAWAAFAAAVLYFSFVPNASVVMFLGIGAVYYGALPFLVALLAVIASVLSGQRTRLRAFAATFGTLIALIILNVAVRH